MNSFLAARIIQRWWRRSARLRVSELKKFVNEWMAWEAGEYEECAHCGDNEAFCDCEVESQKMDENTEILV